MAQDFSSVADLQAYLRNAYLNSGEGQPAGSQVTPVYNPAPQSGGYDPYANNFTIGGQASQPSAVTHANVYNQAQQGYYGSAAQAAAQQGYNQFAAQQGYGGTPWGQNQFIQAQPGYGAGQPGYGAGQPGYGSGQPGYGSGQPGYGSSPNPYSFAGGAYNPYAQFAPNAGMGSGNTGYTGYNGNSLTNGGYTSNGAQGFTGYSDMGAYGGNSLVSAGGYTPNGAQGFAGYSDMGAYGGGSPYAASGSPYAAGGSPYAAGGSPYAAGGSPLSDGSSPVYAGGSQYFNEVTGQANGQPLGYSPSSQITGY
jgi:hypothetical protein